MVVHRQPPTHLHGYPVADYLAPLPCAVVLHSRQVLAGEQQPQARLKHLRHSRTPVTPALTQLCRYKLLPGCLLPRHPCCWLHCSFHHHSKQTCAIETASRTLARVAAASRCQGVLQTRPAVTLWTQTTVRPCATNSAPVPHSYAVLALHCWVNHHSSTAAAPDCLYALGIKHRLHLVCCLIGKTHVALFGLQDAGLVDLLHLQRHRPWIG